MNIFSTFVYEPIYNALIALHSILWGELGLAIIVLTILIKLALFHLSQKQISSQKEMQEIQPKLAELKKKYKDDREQLAKKTMALYKEHHINPAAGCVPLIIQMIVFITLYRVIINLVQTSHGIVDQGILYSITPHIEKVNAMFLGLDLAQKATLASVSALIPLVTAAAQYYQIKMMHTKTQNEKADKQKTSQTDKKNGADGMQDFATIMSKQMLIIIPVMTLVIGFSFPLGLTLYWLVSTLFMIGQQWFIMKKG